MWRIKNVSNKVLFFGFVLSLVVILPVLSTDNNLKVTNINDKKFYHLKFSLNKDNFEVNKKYGFNEGGIFEIFIPKKLFPVLAPNCRENIILRMPWTDETVDNAGQYIGEKKSLYEKLLNIGDNAQEVIIELNPYIRTRGRDVELTRCNVFFRHKNGQYINRI